MPFTITKGRLDGVPFKKARSFSSATINPKAIICHDTAGRLDKFSSVNWFQDKTCKTSAHIVVERDGTVTQMVPLTSKAFHAGASCWNGKQYCNSFTIGIEIVNPGELSKTGKAWFNKTFPVEELHPTPAKFKKSHGDYLWMDYTPEQITAVKQLCRAIMEEYPDCNEVITHYLVSPGRKVDVNPLFPLEEVRRYAAGEDDPPVQPPSDKPAPILIAHEDHHVMQSMSNANPVQTAANQPITVADLLPVSRHVGLLARVRVALNWITGGSFITWLMSLFDYTKGVYDAVSTFVVDHVMVVGIVAVLGALWTVQQLLNWTVGAANEGRYIPSKSYAPTPLLPGPTGLDPQDSL